MPERFNSDKAARNVIATFVTMNGQILRMSQKKSSWVNLGEFASVLMLSCCLKFNYNVY